MEKKKQMEKGITLITLVITIVMLLILAGVTIPALFNEKGIINKAQTIKKETEKAQFMDKLSIIKLDYEAERALSNYKGR